MKKILVIAGAVLFVFFAAMLLPKLLPRVIATSEHVRTDPATETFAGATNAGETSLTYTLANPHEYADTSQMTVSETSPGSGDVTAAATVSADRTQVTISGLAESTAYSHQIEYAVRAENVDPKLNTALRMLPLIIIIGLIGMGVVGFILDWGRIGNS